MSVKKFHLLETYGVIVRTWDVGRCEFHPLQLVVVDGLEERMRGDGEAVLGRDLRAAQSLLGHTNEQ